MTRRIVAPPAARPAAPSSSREELRRSEVVQPEAPPGPPEAHRLEAITPTADLAGEHDRAPELHTEPLEGRIAGTRPAEGPSLAPPPMTTRNISGAGAHSRSYPAVIHCGPERRRRQEEPQRWALEDRRLRPFTYGEKRTL